jgi:hypothetical protein
LIVVLGRQPLFTETTLTVILPSEFRPVLRTVRQEGMGSTFGIVLVRGDFRGMADCADGVALSRRESARVSLPYLTGLGGFNHVIAGSTKQFYLVVTGAKVGARTS